MAMIFLLGLGWVGASCLLAVRFGRFLHASSDREAQQESRIVRLGATPLPVPLPRSGVDVAPAPREVAHGPR